MTLQADTDKLVELFLSLTSTSQESGIAVIRLFERFKLRPYQLEEFEGNQSLVSLPRAWRSLNLRYTPRIPP